MTYSDDLAEEICRRVIMRPIHQVCKDEDMPSESTFYEWLIREPVLSEKYARAREARAFRRYESLDEITQAVRDGQLDPVAGRLLMDAIKWQTGKEQPKVFSEKIQAEHSGPGGAPIQHEATVTLDPSEAYRRLLGGG